MRAILTSNAITRALQAGPALRRLVEVEVRSLIGAFGSTQFVKSGSAGSAGRFMLAQAIVTAVKQTNVAGRAIVRGVITSSKRGSVSAAGRQLVRAAVATAKTMAVTQGSRFVLRGSVSASSGDSGPPQWSTVPTLTSTEGVTETFQVAPNYVTDPDGAPLRVTLHGPSLPTGWTYNEFLRRFTATSSAPIGSASGIYLWADDEQPRPYLTCDDPATPDCPDNQFWNERMDFRYAAINVPDFTSNGGAPWAQQTITATGPIQFNVAALVQRWLTDYNKGFYLSGSVTSDATFGGRLHASPPTLSITTENGTFNPPVLVTAAFQMSTETKLDGRTTFNLNASNRKAVIQFDLSGVTGEVCSAATLTITCTARNGSLVVGVYELNPARLINGGGAPPTLGIANNFVKDSGLENYTAGGAQVWLNARNMDTVAQWSRRDPSGGVGTEYNYDATFDATIMRSRILQGDNEIAYGPERYLMYGGATDGAPPATVITEAYGRYYVKFEDDWLSTINEGGKMPGWDTRQGYWDAVASNPAIYPDGQWINTYGGGNGGVLADGLYVPGSDFQGGGNPALAAGYHGHMLRGGWGSPRTSSAVPYADFMSPTIYMYHLDQGELFGDHTFFKSAAGQHQMKRDRWYCIEHRCRMNSIININQNGNINGNGDALADGIWQTWIDGVLTINRNNLRWRRHPNMGVTTWWIGFYNGGANPQEIPVQHVQVRNVVLANQYIGPMRMA